jgi:hypothetical protein
LFTLYLTNAEGNIVKEFKSLHDATLGDHDAAYALLESYLDNLELEQLERIVFCGDVGSWLWTGAEKLCDRMGFNENKIVQVLDYSHVKQNLRDIIDLVCPTKQAVTTKQWKDLLWNGQMDALEVSIKALVTDKKKLTQAFKKFTNYFAANRKRIQYAQFRAKGSRYVLAERDGRVFFVFAIPSYLRSLENFYGQFNILGTMGISGVYYDRIRSVKKHGGCMNTWFQVCHILGMHPHRDMMSVRVEKKLKSVFSKLKTVD